ncbi:hypothetical protein CHU32_00025 [Superficieibacter electus]|uniref:Uncharacterized protein n=1 Tax=Superficieibacter electus TaxID=2022662 RepID=A0A2P5GVK7_9ENTR|nr:hypothetical protein CHU33_00025 [Superficieibacter electus]POP50592.1 hypothetical protein CHU32_00025 [Superficieibacter electus]
MIYFRRKSIPELKGLPSGLRNRNYRDAFRMVRSHYQFWLGILIYIVLILFFTRLFAHFFPGINAFLKSFFCVLPAVIVWNQINIYLMRKYYRHILQRRE